MNWVYKSESRDSKKHRHINGYTLIELMIVLVIVSMIMGLVGPLTIQSMEKAEAKSELLAIKNWLKQVSYQAFTSGKELHFVVAGKKIILQEENEKNALKTRELEYLFFQPQKFTFNSKGFVSPHIITGVYRDSTLELNLNEFVNGSSKSNALSDVNTTSGEY